MVPKKGLPDSGGSPSEISQNTFDYVDGGLWSESTKVCRVGYHGM